MTTTNRPLRLGSLELLHDRLIHATSSRAGYMVETLHLDQVHRTAVRFGHRPVYAALSLLLAVASVFGPALGPALGHLSEGTGQVGFGVAAVLFMIVYLLTRSVQLCVSAGGHTVTMRLSGRKASTTAATRFVLEVDAAAMQARRSRRGSQVWA